MERTRGTISFHFNFALDHFQKFLRDIILAHQPLLRISQSKTQLYLLSETLEVGTKVSNSYKRPRYLSHSYSRGLGRKSRTRIRDRGGILLSLDYEGVSALDMPDVPMGQLPPHIELQRTRVLCAPDAPSQTEKIQYSGAYASMGVDNSLCLDQFFKNFKVDVIRLNEDEMEFDMISVDASIANAFRRILISEVPTMAIEKVLIANNTSVVQDEVLAHRLGLIPIKVDPRMFEYLSENDTPNEKNTIVFKLHVKCERGQPRLTVKSDELKWLPNGSEFEMATENPTSNPNSRPKTYTSFSCSQDSLPEFAKNPIAPKHPDIIISKLGPGQEIELEAHAVKGIGKTHAKWSPVATTWYRMLPEVVLLEEIEDEKAEELVKKCPVNVFDIEDIAKGRKRATVARPRACTLCRECIREEDWDKLVAIRRVKDHLIFTIESTGALPPEVLFTEAIKILEEKCERVISELS